jgi:hypothetical protein
MLGPVGNVNLPTPVVLAGAGLCLLGGYLIGVGGGARVTGDSVEEHDGAEEGVLCGIWQRAEGSESPSKGDRFRFVSKVSHGQAGRDDDRVLIFGEVDD